MPSNPCTVPFAGPQPISTGYCVGAWAPAPVAPVLAFTPRPSGSVRWRLRLPAEESGARVGAASATRAKAGAHSEPHPAPALWGLGPASPPPHRPSHSAILRGGAGVRGPSGCGKGLSLLREGVCQEKQEGRRGPWCCHLMNAKPPARSELGCLAPAHRHCSPARPEHHLKRGQASQNAVRWQPEPGSALETALSSGRERMRPQAPPLGAASRQPGAGVTGEGMGWCFTCSQA